MYTKKLLGIASYATQKIFNFFLPSLCAHCRSVLSCPAVFCSDCYAAITPVVSTELLVTKTKKIKLFAVCSYQDPVRSLILAKSRSDIVSANQLGQLLWQMTYLKNVHFDFIVPIPLHWTRFARRGFNQAEQMAKIISKQTGKPVANILRRTKKTKLQASLDKVGRAENVKGAFVLKQKVMQGKTILLVDDLCTTGATLRFAARCLYQLQPASIIAAVACRVT